MAAAVIAAIIVAAAAVGSAAYSGVAQGQAQKKQKKQFEEATAETHRQEVYNAAGDVVKDTRDLFGAEEQAMQNILDKTKGQFG